MTLTLGAYGRHGRCRRPFINQIQEVKVMTRTALTLLFALGLATPAMAQTDCLQDINQVRAAEGEQVPFRMRDGARRVEKAL
jgi:hypothetical protein